MSVESVRRALGVYHPRRVAYKGAVWGRLRAERWALAARQRAAGGPSPVRRGRILAYHSIGTPVCGVNDLRPRDFERHLQIAVDDGWSFATPAEVIADPDKPQLALTFDDGMASVLANALPVLRHHGIPATAFVVTGWADGEIPENWRRIVLDWLGVNALREGGMTLASHSVTHSDFGRLEPADVRRELEVSRERLRQVLGAETSEFAIPMGQSRNWTPAAGLAAAQAGYTSVYAQCVGTRPEGTIARTFITRIDRPVLFRAALAGAYDNWEEWYLSARTGAVALSRTRPRLPARAASERSVGFRSAPRTARGWPLPKCDPTGSGISGINHPPAWHAATTPPCAPDFAGLHRSQSMALTSTVNLSGRIQITVRTQRNQRTTKRNNTEQSKPRVVYPRLLDI